MAKNKPPRLRSPIGYFGGKGNMVAKLLKFVPKHHTYVEVFGGGASLLFAKEPTPVEVYNDLDSNLVRFFRVLRDPNAFGKLHDMLVLTPYSREEFYHCRKNVEELDDVMFAWRWFVRQRQGFSGGGSKTPSWSYAITLSRRNMSGAVSKWLSAIDMLPAIHERISHCQIEHDTFQAIIPRYDTPDTFFYLDPPYVASTRKSGGYAHEMTDEDHAELVNLVLNVKGMILLSGYASSVYEPLTQANWQRVDFETACYAVGKTRGTGIQGKVSAKAKQPRTETLWLNPALQEALDPKQTSMVMSLSSSRNRQSCSLFPGLTA